MIKKPKIDFVIDRSQKPKNKDVGLLVGIMLAIVWIFTYMFWIAP